MAYNSTGEWYSSYKKKDKTERMFKGGPEFDRRGRPIIEEPYAPDRHRGAQSRGRGSAESGKEEGRYQGSGLKKTPGGKPSYDRAERAPSVGKYKASKDGYREKEDARRSDRQDQGNRRTAYGIERRPTETAPVYQSEDTLPCIIYGRNPVREAIKSGKSVDKLFILSTGSEDGSLREIMKLARDKALVVTQVSRQRLDEMTLPFGYGGKPAVHQGVIAQLSEAPYAELSDIIAKGEAHKDSYPPFVLLLDSINDPHNLGAIIRTAVCAGVDGVVIPKRRSASLTAAAAKASAGALVYASVARVPNLSAAAKELKDAGYWIAGADVSGRDMHEAPLSGALALVIGGEDEGISRLLKEQCDFLASIPLFGEVNSLNASAAAAVLMYEKLRQDGRK